MFGLYMLAIYLGVAQIYDGADVYAGIGRR